MGHSNNTSAIWVLKAMIRGGWKKGWEANTAVLTQLLNCTNYQLLNCTNYQLFNCTNYQLLNCANYQLLNYTNYQLLNYTNYQLLSVLILKEAHEYLPRKETAFYSCPQETLS